MSAPLYVPLRCTSLPLLGVSEEGEQGVVGGVVEKSEVVLESLGCEVPFD